MLKERKAKKVKSCCGWMYIHTELKMIYVSNFHLATTTTTTKKSELHNESLSPHPNWMCQYNVYKPKHFFETFADLLLWPARSKYSRYRVKMKFFSFIIVLSCGVLGELTTISRIWAFKVIFIMYHTSTDWLTDF